MPTRGQRAIGASFLKFPLLFLAVGSPIDAPQGLKFDLSGGKDGTRSHGYTPFRNIRSPNGG